MTETVKKLGDAGLESKLDEIITKIHSEKLTAKEDLREYACKVFDQRFNKKIDNEQNLNNNNRNRMNFEGRTQRADNVSFPPRSNTGEQNQNERSYKTKTFNNFNKKTNTKEEF